MPITKNTHKSITPSEIKTLVSLGKRGVLRRGTKLRYPTSEAAALQELELLAREIQRNPMGWTLLTL